MSGMGTSEMSDSLTPCFGFSGKSDLVVGSQGTGSIDYVKSDFDVVTLRQISRLSTLDEAQFRDFEGVPSIRMKSNVKPFNVHYDSKVNLLLVAPDIREDIEDGGGTVREGREVECLFGRKTLPYFAYNLLNYFVCDHAVDWSSSSFIEVEPNKFQIGRTRVGRGELPETWKPKAVSSALVFDGYEEFNQGRRDYLGNWLIPEVLVIHSEAEAKIINFNSAITLVHDDLSRKISDANDSGMFFLRSRVAVRQSVEILDK